ncbi:MAG: c-type cytochrome [Chitinophagaceae bacterium]|nr:c-type cytochrome [Oligoflexus sp.]
MTCHGLQGEGIEGTTFPKLAHLGAAYVANQLLAFRSKDRPDPAMQVITQGLTDSEITALADYISQLPPSSEIPKAQLSEKAIRGEDIAKNGLWDKGIPACFACHGPSGFGIGEIFPKITLQDKSYILQQLSDWKKDARKSDRMNLMRTIAGKLSTEEAEAVSAYLSAPSSQSQTYKTSVVKSFPDGEMGRIIRLGQEIFTHTQDNAKPYVGNDLQCVNCHLDRGRRPNSSPLGAAYGMYPAFRKKTNRVDTFQDRIAGCFQYSMNGKAPATDSEVMTALVTYSYWLAQGVPLGAKIEGQGYLSLPRPARKPSAVAGRLVFERSCSLCHGLDGQGQASEGKTVFPPLWGPRSFNWGAGMHKPDRAAGFIKANMPLGLANTLSNQEAWDVAVYMNSHERPPDPRSQDNVPNTKKDFHDSDACLYGTKVDGHVLGSQVTSSQ